ncbi:MAG TPA: hypothetical protein PLZ43_14720 [bacterium]|nr:hypothetical protein [bacterium]
MQLSNSGKVIILEDNPEEIKPLIESLSKEKIPYFLYNGDMDLLPEVPFEGIRFVFLDIDLGTGVTGVANLASALIARLRKLISRKNGPFVIIFWTKHAEVINKVLENCETAGIAPIKYLDLEKPATADHRDFNLETIRSKLHEKLATIDAFQLYVEWENILNTAGVEFVNKFSSLATAGTNWSRETADIFFKLYKSAVGVNESTNNNEKFKYACGLLNRSFLGTLEQKIKGDLCVPENFRIINNTNSSEIAAKINTALYLTKDPIDKKTTGCVIRKRNIKISKSLCDAIFKTDKAPVEKQLCFIIVTPACDLAQNKFLNIEINQTLKHKIHRVIYGIFFKRDGNTKNKDKNEAIFPIKPFWHKDSCWEIIFHLSSLTTISENEIKGSPVFSLKEDLVFDIQSKAANHVNRLGNSML